MTFDYDQSTAILGPLATQADPIGYDLCKHHADRLSVPRGWEVIRLANSFVPPPPNDAELMALANAVRAASESDRPRQQVPMQSNSGPVDRDDTKSREPQAKATGMRRGHLTLIQDSPQ